MSKNGITLNFNFCGLLAILFIALKLCKVIDWSWLWVLSPLWIPLALVSTTVVLWIVLMARS